MENVQLFILCTQSVKLSSILNKQAAFPRESCPFIDSTAFLLWTKGLPRRWSGGRGSSART